MNIAQESCLPESHSPDPTAHETEEYPVHARVSDVERHYAEALLRARSAHELRIAELQKAEAAAEDRLQEIEALSAMNPEAKSIVDLREQELSMRTNVRSLEAHLHSLEEMVRQRSQDLERTASTQQAYWQQLEDNSRSQQATLSACVERILEAEGRYQQLAEKLSSIEEQITQRQIDLATLCQRLAREEARLLKDSESLRESVDLLRAEELAVRKRVSDQKIFLGQVQAESNMLREDLYHQEQSAYYIKPDSQTKLSEADYLEVTKRLVKLADLTTTAQEFLQKPANLPSAPEQFKFLREATMAALSALKVAEVVIEPGTFVDWEMRSKLQISGHQSGNGMSVVREMLSPGYAVVSAEGRQFFIRKPEVLTAAEEILHS